MSDRFRSTSAPASAGLSAVFVSDGAEDKPDTATLVGSMGVGSLRFPAVLVPEGAERPGYPFVEFGELRGGDEPARAAPSSSHQYAAAERGLHASHSDARSHMHPARHEGESMAASDEARPPSQAGSPPAVAPDGRLHDYAADAIHAAHQALAVPPTYDSLSELVDLAVPDEWFAALPRLP